MSYRQLIILLILLIVTLSLRAQSGIVECKRYYSSINRNGLIKEYEFGYNSSRDSSEIIMRKQFPKFSLGARFNFWKSEPLLIIGVKIEKTELEKSLGDYLYNYVGIDNNNVDLLYLDKKGRPDYWIYRPKDGNNDDIVIEPLKDKKRNEFKKAVYKSFKSVLNKEPDLILYNHDLNLKLYGAIIYLKDSRIYILPFQRGKIFELNEYFKKYDFP